jgi:quercetin dioxygenase-like cupin family protein
MKKQQLCLVALGLLALASLPISGAGKKGATPAPPPAAPTPVAIPAKDVVFGPGPDSLEPGAQLALLAPNPATSGGQFTFRVKLPNGFLIKPHSHPIDERFTVIDGTVVIGIGNVVDRGVETRLGAGSYAFTPAGTPHYVRVIGNTVVQVHGVGAYEMVYVNPADDPRNRR